LDSWFGFSFAIRGRKNMMENLPCQDSVRTWSDGNVACAVLSDGAGSAIHSYRASNSVVNSAIVYYRRFIENGNDRSLLETGRSVLEAVRERIKSKAQKLNTDIKDLACTFLGVFIKDSQYLILHIGDGIVACMMEDGCIKLLSAGYRGEFAGETVFLTSESYENYMKVIEGDVNQERIKAFYLMSDGMESVVYSKRENRFGKLLDKLYALNLKYNDKKELKRKLKESGRELFNQRTHDDLSIALLGRS